MNSEDAKNLTQIQFKKNNAWIDIYKNLSDLAFNTYTVFNIALPLILGKYGWVLVLQY